MPWKNGLGTTTEIAVHPDGAPLDAFAWRISIAEVAVSGPFSRFPGHDRILVQISGPPMTLSHEGQGEHRLSLLTPYAFAGELATYATLGHPPARDFNVMVRRDEASARVSAPELAPGSTVGAEGGDGRTHVAHVLEGGILAHVARNRAAARAGETVVARGGAALELTAAAEGAVVLLVEIGPREAFRPKNGC
jgi:environmental stress-induced protein Ves